MFLHISNFSHLFVVIKYCVHVFNPDGVHRPIKDDPLAMMGGAGRMLTERVRQNT